MGLTNADDADRPGIAAASRAEPRQRQGLGGYTLRLI
jgi:hypothetical protein